MSYPLYLSSLDDCSALPEGVCRLFVARVPCKNLKERGLYHVPQLAPSSALLTDYKRRGLSWSGYVERFAAEAKAMTPFLRRVTDSLARYPVALVCYCNERRCHRYLLADLLRGLVPDLEVVDFRREESLFD